MPDAKEFAKRAAKKNGWILQPDAGFLKTVTAGLDETRRIHGYFLCPCREGWGEREKDRDIICPCDYAGADIEEYGQCFCGLFLSAEKARSGNAAEAIPDRRPEDLYPD
jgi:ferredoxin-thioredoxin reductase catalytic chain